jgi:hypothetical protein
VSLKIMNQSKKLQWSLFLIVPVILEAWVWLSYLSSRRLLSSYFYAQLIGIQESSQLPRGVSISLPVVLIVIILIAPLLTRAHARQYKSYPMLWVWAVLVCLSVMVWPLWFVVSGVVCIPLVLFIQNKTTVYVLKPWAVATLAVITIVLSLPLRLLDSRQSKLETAQAQLASAYVEQRLVDSRLVLYYGKGAGLYDVSGFYNPTRYSDLSVLQYDNDRLTLESTFRGDAEASSPMFAIIAMTPNLKAFPTPRLDQYFEKHYEKVADLDGYQILKRK